MPAALLLLAAFYAWRRAVAHLLPQPLRTLCLARCDVYPRLDARGALAIAAALALGIWSHILWDSFTHPWGWFVQNWAVLHTNYLSLGFYDVYGFKIAQHASTLVGLAAIVAYIARWTRQRAPGVGFALERARLRAWIGIAAGSLAAGLISTTLNYPSHAGMLCYFVTTGTLAFVVLAVIAGSTLALTER